MRRIQNNKSERKFKFKAERTISNKEFLAAIRGLYTLALIVELVGLLVVDKDVGRADTLKPGFQDRFVSDIRK